ncbi:hypothetical protein SAMN05421755_102124 [Nitrosomonas sp. Nm33]|nr:hypothetical protein SAMN05421755_102124 [Nitrosomonas sp. Nm33]
MYFFIQIIILFHFKTKPDFVGFSAVLFILSAALLRVMFDLEMELAANQLC